ncbi:MAG TPA: abortive infection family protein [Cyclobacteriaceae bacterium]|nr:abortive infection family protein [Cyclobacteriaceae bacterium]
MNDLYLQIDTFKNLLVNVATSGSHSDDEYKTQRTAIIEISELKDLIPNFVVSNRSVDQFWQFIKGKFQTYKERREYLWTEFEAALRYAERKKKVVAEDLTHKIGKFNLELINEEWRKALKRSADDPEGAITSARTLIETTCKHILDKLGNTYKDDLELPKLYKLTADGLNLAPDQHTEQIFKQILGGCQTVVEGLGAMRNKLSDSHGKKISQVRPATRHAELAINLSGAMTTFLLETFESKMIKNKP